MPKGGTIRAARAGPLFISLSLSLPLTVRASRHLLRNFRASRPPAEAAARGRFVRYSQLPSVIQSAAVVVVVVVCRLNCSHNKSSARHLFKVIGGAERRRKMANRKDERRRGRGREARPKGRGSLWLSWVLVVEIERELSKSGPLFGKILFARVTDLFSLARLLSSLARQ